MSSSQDQPKYRRLLEILEDHGPAAVAFSGGVDSSLLLKASHTVFPKQAVGFFVNSQVQPKAEVNNALQVSREIGCSMKIIEMDVLQDPLFRANPENRCYICKKTIYTLLLKEAEQYGLKLLDGSNVDDTRQHRPGAKAIEELGVVSPLILAGLHKREIRRLSRELGLSTWNKYSASCLATRIAHGEPIDKEKLELIEAGEAVLLHLGFPGCRMRLLGNSAFIEFVRDNSDHIGSGTVRQKVVEGLKTLGIEKVFLDLSEREGILT